MTLLEFLKVLNTVREIAFPRDDLQQHVQKLLHDLGDREVQLALGVLQLKYREHPEFAVDQAILHLQTAYSHFEHALQKPDMKTFALLHVNCVRTKLTEASLQVRRHIDDLTPLFEQSDRHFLDLYVWERSQYQGSVSRGIDCNGRPYRDEHRPNLEELRKLDIVKAEYEKAKEKLSQQS